MDRSVSDRQDTPNNRLSELMEKAHSRGEVNAEDPSEKAQASAEVDAEAKAEETSREELNRHPGEIEGYHQHITG